MSRRKSNGTARRQQDASLVRQVGASRFQVHHAGRVHVLTSDERQIDWKMDGRGVQVWLTFGGGDLDGGDVVARDENDAKALAAAWHTSARREDYDGDQDAEWWVALPEGLADVIAPVTGAA